MDFGLIAASSTELTAQAIAVFQGVWILVVIAIGIPLGFYIIKKIIGVIPKR